MHVLLALLLAAQHPVVPVPSPASDTARVVGVAPTDVRARVPPAVSERDSTLLRVLAINDFHGALEARTWPWSNGRPVGGAAALKPWLDSLARACGCTTVRLDGGDEMQGTLLSNFSFGLPAIATLNAFGIDAATIGNHEFDWSVDTLRARMAGAKYRFLAANITDSGGTARPEWAEPWTLIQRGGLKIAVIGLALRATPTNTAPRNVRGLAFGDGAAAVRRVLPRARAAADFVIVLAHEGAFCDGAPGPDPVPAGHRDGHRPLRGAHQDRAAPRWRGVRPRAPHRRRAAQHDQDGRRARQQRRHSRGPRGGHRDVRRPVPGAAVSEPAGAALRPGQAPQGGARARGRRRPRGRARLGARGLVRSAQARRASGHQGQARERTRAGRRTHLHRRGERLPRGGRERLHDVPGAACRGPGVGRPGRADSVPRRAAAAGRGAGRRAGAPPVRSEEHTSELQ